MQSPRTALRALLTLVLATALLAPATAAFAVDARGPVPNNAFVNGTPLKGLSESEARARLAAVPALTPVIVKGDGKTFTWTASAARAAVSVTNVNAMLDAAYTPPASVESSATTYTLTPAYSVNSATLAAWAASIAKKVDRKAVNAKRYVKSRKLKVTAEKTGRKVNQATTATYIKNRLLWEAKWGVAKGQLPKTVGISCQTLQPKITRKNIGKAILVVLKYRKIYLYKNTTVQKKYRCAVGTRSYPTPTGKFKITAKRYRPTWVNPAPNGWGANMPARIGPGPRNPLGTRALNLSASGIRIHGTYKTSSIGRAASHGCMRMLRKDVEDLYKRVSVGTPVYIVK